MELSVRGKTGMALTHFKQAIVIAPRYTQSYYQTGNCLARLGLYTESIEKYKQAIQIDPASPDPREKMDQLLNLQKDNKK